MALCTSAVRLMAGMCLMMIARSAGATVDDPNFTETTVVTADPGLTGATAMAWAPDGSNRLFVTRKGGEVRIIKDGKLLPAPFATLSPVFTDVECGLLGIAFDPDFVDDHYVYLFVTVSASEQQIIRYTANGDLGADKLTIVASIPTAGLNHDGGGPRHRDGERSRQ